MDLIPNTLTTIVPGLAPYIFKVYSAVNTGAYGRELMGAFTGEFEGTITRFRNFGFFGYALALAILSYIPFRSWLSPNRLWVAPALLLSLFLTALSGFRSQIFYICVGGFVALWATARRKAFLLVPIGLIALGIITVSQGTVLEYPLGVQRAFSFLPGNWNQRALADAEQSSLWRKEMRELFFVNISKRRHGSVRGIITIRFIPCGSSTFLCELPFFRCPTCIPKFVLLSNEDSHMKVIFISC